MGSTSCHHCSERRGTVQVVHKGVWVWYCNTCLKNRVETFHKKVQSVSEELSIK